MDQTFTLPSNALKDVIRNTQQAAQLQAYPLNKYSPVSLQSNEKIHAPWPVRFATWSPEETSYKAITLESPAAASSLPPGENATARTGLTRPSNTLVAIKKLDLWMTCWAMSETIVQYHC